MSHDITDLKTHFSNSSIRVNKNCAISPSNTDITLFASYDNRGIPPVNRRKLVFFITMTVAITLIEWAERRGAAPTPLMAECCTEVYNGHVYFILECHLWELKHPIILQPNTPPRIASIKHTPEIHPIVHYILSKLLFITVFAWCRNYSITVI